MARSLNKVVLIGNLTRDPELRYTPSGSAVCTFSLATNRQWTTESGEKKEDAEFHRIVAWNKLAEICGQYLTKGRKVYVEGRLQTRKWAGQDGAERQTTEVIINDMIILDNQGGASKDFDIPDEALNDVPVYDEGGQAATAKKPTSKPKADEPANDDDIPF
jgi:single-strand DNA-binding protein